MPRLVISFRAMGCQMHAWLETTADGPTLLSQVPVWFEEFEAVLSRFRPQSELSQLNAQGGRWVEVSQTLLEAIMAAQRAALLTDGIYNPFILPALAVAGYDRPFDQWQGREFAPIPDIQVPDWRELKIKPSRHAIFLPENAQLDLGGVAKGWAAQQIARRLGAYGDCLIDAGGDLVAIGQTDWPVHVANPGDAEHPLTTVLVTDQTIATSGIDYRRWGENRHHLIDPTTGKPADTDVMSATVIHPDAVLAEAYAKTIVIKGCTAGLPWFAGQIDQHFQQHNSAALVVCADGRVLATDHFLSFTIS